MTLGLKGPITYKEKPIYTSILQKKDKKQIILA